MAGRVVAEPLRGLSHAVERIQVAGPIVCLAHGFVDPGRLSVQAGDEELVAGRDYELDAPGGCLELTEPERRIGAALLVRYAFFPFALESRYARRSPAVIPSGVRPDSALPVVRHTDTGTPVGVTGSGLRIRGYKTLAVQLGPDREPSLQQSLDLNVSGEIATGVELRALLSDRDLPLQAEGNTETLDELDKVMLEVRTANLAATLGDYDINAFGGEFLSYSKRLEGVKAEGTGDGRGFVLAAAVAKGQFLSLELPGVEGKQGPYVLTDASGSDLITVIAGSEAVWLDGVRMTRGESQDYTIDYGRGEVTFTPRRLITQDSRITVDFEFSTQSYERNFYVGGARSAFMDGALEMGVSIVSEADDAGNPLLELSETARGQLSSAGDSTRSATRLPGVRVEMGDGDYIAVELAGGGSRFQYAGSGRGDYLVTFQEIGAGAGDYEDSTTGGGTAYRYVGLMNGAFQPVRPPAAPLAHRLADLTAAWRGSETLSMEGELAISGLDWNTLSSLDDFDNRGGAGRFRLTAAPLAGWSERGPTLKAGYREIGPSFEPLGRLRAADYAYTWNAPPGAFDAGERQRDLGFAWGPGAGLSLGGELAQTSSNTYRGRRRRLHTQLDRAVRARFAIERTNGSGLAAGSDGSETATTADRERAVENGELSMTLGRVTPRIRFDREERIERLRAGQRSGTVYERIDAAGVFNLWRRARLEIGGARRLDRSLATGSPWRLARRAHEQRYGLELPRWRALSVSGSFTRRSTETVATGGRQISDLVQVDLVSSALGGGLESEAHYDVTTTDVSASGRVLVFVGGGQGGYDAFGRFVGTGGDYDLVLAESGGAPDLRTRLLISARTEFRPGRMLGGAGSDPPALARVLGWMGLETDFLVDESTRLPLASPRLFLDPSNYQRDDTTFNGRFRLRQDLDLWEERRALAVRLRYERVDEADNRTAGVLEDRGERRYALRLRSAPRPELSAEWTMATGNRFESERSLVAGSESRLDLRQGEHRLELASRPHRLASFKLELARIDERDRPTDARSTTIEWSPSLTVNRQRLRLDWRIRRAVETREGVFPFFYRLGTPAGTRADYTFAADYRATDGMTLAAGLDAIDRPGDRLRVTTRLEMRAAF